MTLNLTLQDCPVEILQLIISSLSLTELYAVQNTSTFLQKVSQPILYRHLKWEFDKPSRKRSEKAKEEANEREKLRPGLHLLLKRLLRDPKLGSVIQSIEFEQKKTIHTIFWNKHTSVFTPDEFERLAERGRSITGSQNEKWLEELQIGNYDAFVTILLSYCPNLKKLVLQNDFTIRWVWNPDPAIAPNYDTLWSVILSLQKLEEIDCDRYATTTIPFKSNRVPLLLQLPNITSLRLSIDDREIYPESKRNGPIFILEDGTIANWDAPPSVKKHGRAVDMMFQDMSAVPCTIPSTLKSPKLKTLELYESAITEHAFKAVVATAANLTSLTLEIARCWCDGFIYSMLRCDILREALTANVDEANSSSPLEHLAIRCMWKGSDDVVSLLERGRPLQYSDGSYISNFQKWFDLQLNTVGPCGTIGSLKHLTKLKRLEVAPQIFLCWWPDEAPPLKELIPDSLTCLILRHDYSDWDTNHEYGWDVDDYTNLIRQYGKSTTTGNLQKVKFIFPEGDPEEVNVWLRGSRKLRRVCSKAGLEYDHSVEAEVDNQRPEAFDPDYEQSTYGVWENQGDCWGRVRHVNGPPWNSNYSEH